MVEFDSRLNHQGDYPWPYVGKARFFEDPPVYSERFGCSFAAGHCKLCQALSRPPGNGHFGANHVDRLLRAIRLLRGSTENRGSVGNQLVGERAAFVRTSHAGIKMYLLEPCPHIGLHSLLGFAHGLKRRLPLPWIGSQMISAEDQPRLVESLAGGNLDNTLPEIFGQHARVATMVIHLVGGGLNQKVRSIFKCLVNGCFKHPMMRRAD